MLAAADGEESDDKNVLVSFSAMGDAPYIFFEDLIISTYIQRLPKASKFLLHVGDIKRGAVPCEEKIYKSVADLMKKAIVPVFMVPGDNEWNDCADPDAAWKLWEKYWLKFDDHWPHQLDVKRQEVRPENLAFVENDVLFLGLNVVGGRQHDIVEWRLRHAQGLDWIREHFATKDLKAAVVFLHAAPSKTQDDFFTPFVVEASRFGRPVLLIHGDGHVWQRENPWKQKNLQRVQVDRGGLAPPLFIQVTDDPQHPFTIDRQLSLTIAIPESEIEDVGQ